MRTIKMDAASYAILTVATLVLTFAGLHGFQNKSITIISFGIGAILVVIGLCLYWQEAVWKNDEKLKSSPSKLENVGSSSLTEPKPTSASPTVSPTAASPSPKQTPSTTPEHRVASLSMEDVHHKLSEAIDSSESDKYHEVQNALIGLRVDWTLNFFSASRDSSGKFMQVTLHDPKQMMGLVWIKLPLASNERLPLMERTDVFRVRGIIDNPRIVGIDLRDATLEYVSSGKA
jgi:hypothetical protein